MNTEPTPEKKLVVDEDWKSQVEAEKEAARHSEEPPKPAEPSAAARGPLPPADLGFLIGTLYIQGAMAPLALVVKEHSSPVPGPFVGGHASEFH